MGILDENDLVSDPGLVFRPLCAIDGSSPSSTHFKESELPAILEAYYSRLSEALSKSFAQPKLLVQQAMNNNDPHFLFLTSKNASLPIDQRVKGLLVFSKDPSVRVEPAIDEEKGKITFQRMTKVQLHHVSSIDHSQIEVVLDMGLDYIWKTMHCSAIRVYLYDYIQMDPKTEAEKLMTNEEIKQLFTKRVFRWAQRINDSKNGTRTLIMEGKNCEYKQ